MDRARKIAAAILLAVITAVFIISCGSGEDDVGFLNKAFTKSFNMTDEVVKNPLTGFAPQAKDIVYVADNPLVYVDVTFKELEPTEGVYDFEAIEKENNFELWREQGKHVVFRFVCDFPEDEAHMDIPQWLYDKIGGDGTVYDTSYGKGFSPNYNNELFIIYHQKAIKALGERFGGDNFFAYIELGSLGHWGEWHVKYEDGIIRLPGEYARLDYIRPYMEAFPNAKILMRRPFKAAGEYGFGLYNDMAGDPDSTAEWLDWIENGGDFRQTNEKGALVPMPNAWKTAPVGGELTSSLAMDYMIKFNTAQTVELIKASHTTFLGPKFPRVKNESTDEAFAAGIDTLLLNMGYRLGVTKAVVSEKFIGKDIKVSLTWTNEGVAPMYWDWPVYIYMLDKDNNLINKIKTDVKLTQILPGEQIKSITAIPLSKEPGYGTKLCVGIEDPLTGEPAITLVTDAARIGKLSVIHEY